MTTHKPAGRRLHRAAVWGFAALLAAALPLAAQGHSSHGGGGGHSAHSSGARAGASHGVGRGRVAHAIPGRPGFRGGRGFHGGFRGDRFFFFPGFGWGFWPGLSFWWWDEPYYPYPYYDPYYYSPRPEVYDGGGDGGGYDRSEMGALDLDVSPSRTHVFVNGEDLGVVDRYDGWPGYLWLPQGTYDVVFYLDGYKTIARQVTVYPGTVADISDKMVKGPSVRPEDLASKTHERRDDRVQYEQWRRQQIDQQGQSDDDQDWRDRVHRQRAAPPPQMDDDGDNDGGNNPPPPPPRRPARDGVHAARGYLRLSVEPEDASIYLDGRFVGTGADLSMLRGGLSVTPGHHQLSIVRPGRKAEERDFDATAGEDVKLNVQLEGGSR
jgi:hypothetical protein